MYNTPGRIIIYDNTINASLVREFSKLSKMKAKFDECIETLQEDALIYNYKASTENQHWTEHGRMMISEFLKNLRTMSTILKTCQFKKGLKLSNKECRDLYYFFRYQLLKHSANQTLTTMDDLFEISTFYKYIKKKRAPAVYEVQHLYLFQHYLSRIIGHLEWLFKMEEDVKNKTSKLLKRAS